MTSRHSRRLQGLAPEHQTFQDRCFICLLDLEVQSLKRCRPMPCCGKFVHKRCFTKARKNSNQCGHCRVETLDSDDTLSVNSTEALRADESLPESEDNDDPIWRMPHKLRGPTRIERARNAIALCRVSARAHNVHTPNSLSCRIMWMSPPGSCSGSNWIGSFPPMLDNPCQCTSTGSCTHPFHPCQLSGKPCTETSID